MSDAAPPAVPLRPLGVAEILDGGVRCVRNNLRAALTLALPLALVRAVVQALVTLHSSGTLGVQLLTQGLLGGFFGTMLTGLLAPVFAAELLGDRIGAGESLRRLGRVWPRLALMCLVVAVAEQFGGLLVLGVWLWGVWAVAAPALALEGTSAFRSLGRSVGLVSGRFWRTWGIRALRWVLTSVLAVLLGVPFTLLAAAVSSTDLFSGDAPASGGLYVSIVAIGQVLVLAVTAPISAAVDSLLYADLRMRAEGMDILLALPPEPAPPAAAAVGTSLW